jgi:peptidoglycan hydrolase CwlO-like protein
MSYAAAAARLQSKGAVRFFVLRTQPISMSDSLRFLARTALVVIAMVPLVVAAQQPDDGPTLSEAQRRLRLANEQLDRAHREVTRAQRSLQTAQAALDEAQRDLKRKQVQAEEADGRLLEAQRQRDAARGAIERLYEGQQR